MGGLGIALGLIIKLGIPDGIANFAATFGTSIGQNGRAGIYPAMNLPVALAGVLLSEGPLIDMGRTALNVSGSFVAVAVSGRVLGEIDMAVYNSKDAELDQVQIS